jgi:hypothetical protein
MSRPLVGLSLLALALVLAASAGQSVPAMLENARLLHSIGGLYSPDVLADPQHAWDAGWQRLCGQPAEPALPLAHTPSAQLHTLAAALRLGDFPSAGQTASDMASVGARATTVSILDLLAGDWTGAAEAAADRPAEVPPVFWGTVQFLAAQQSARDGLLSIAAAHLVEADGLVGERGPLASPGLARCLARWGRPVDAQDEWRRAASLLPADARTVRALADNDPRLDEFIPYDEWLSRAATHPSHVLDATIASALLRVTTYWQVSERPEQVAARHLLVRDLVANGSFDWGFAAPNVSPFGFPGSVYHNRVPIRVESDAGRGNVLCMTRPTREEGVGLEGLGFGLSEHTSLLVQGGAVRSPNASGYALAERWLGTDQPSLYSFAASGPAAPAEWTLFVGTVERPPAARAVSVWILNAAGEPGGETCYDDLFLFEAQPPDIAASTGSNARS